MTSTATDPTREAVEPVGSNDPTPSREVLLDLHRRMVRIRQFETEAGRLMEGGRMPGFLHLYVGQEAVAAGTMSNLRDTDQITSTHRGHGHAVAKGAEFKPMFAELFGRVDGYCKGRGGSMHINDLSIGMLGANGIVGGGIPIAVGAAFAAKYREEDSVAVPFFGDGASNIGAFHEAANIAGILGLPVVFVCENNGYAEFTALRDHMKLENVADRAAAYGFPSEICDGMDAIAVRAAVGRAVERARNGGGPTLVEAKTYRYYDHQGVKGLRKTYRTAEEVEAWKERDAIKLLEARAVTEGLVTEAEFATVWAEVDADIAESVSFAEASPYPDLADFALNVYSD
ncbi:MULTISPECIES: thiamine pyrophosphate-dependent dehydrogenase E1 component subunit alpha [unclassified Rhodococcus (in: high G+C Gram-positive bacteria)]|uniref:thiamine pyrophosphate-dependent dehydrogenase E1 component subunit alpha n=1 Tax=unclassified Rhodococcus (in: high G+C Gram-positive bacteria) TaxID=192944 RepID=UPI0022B24623|nr:MULTISPECIES: thiamine pyrophosphate-dependent dehydrogenase E1 component subunit alpha [unclassified Rhodococcus (in: high G+C Gram-positive bacteria)]MDV7987494.1 thiamine pyrophosphate-dependent dehydrogenase E1 component subunit alpha [Rhodococcus sp. IEGM 1374]